MADFKRQDAGINTVEGTVAGARALELAQQRIRDQQEFERLTQEKKQSHRPISIHDKFAGASTGSAQDQAFRAQTIGLVTAEEFKEATRKREAEAAAQEAAALCAPQVLGQHPRPHPLVK